MSEQNQTQTAQTNPAPGIYAYTQHYATIKAIEEKCRVKITVLSQDRSKDPVDDILSQMPIDAALLYAVLPIDKALELRQAAPHIRIRLMQLDGKAIEKLTGKPYDPKADYSADMVMSALKVIEIKGGSVRYLTVEDLKASLRGKKVAVFNDVMREALQRLVTDAVFVKSCDDCTEVNPLGYKSGIRISFPGTAGKLTAEQMAEAIKHGEARIYYAEVVAEEVSPCAA